MATGRTSTSRTRRSWRRCRALRGGAEHPIGDSADYLEAASLDACACECGGESFEITGGVSVDETSGAVRWFYLGGRCVACGLTAVYGDWTNEHESYETLLAKV